MLQKIFMMIFIMIISNSLYGDNHIDLYQDVETDAINAQIDEALKTDADATTDTTIDKTANKAVDAKSESNKTEDIGNIMEIKTYPKKIQTHPIANHFAVALPIVTFILVVLSMIMFNKLTMIDFIFLLLSSAVMYLAFQTGNESYKIVTDTPIAQHSKDMLIYHKKMGFILLAVSALLIAMRVILLIFRPKNFITLYVIVFMVYIGLVLHQGHDGISMVYTYGVGVYYDSIGGIGG